MYIVKLSLGSRDPLRDFCRRHNLTPRRQLQAARPVLEAVIESLAAVYAEVHKNSPGFPNDKDALWGVLLTMLGRTHAHVEAALVAAISGSPESSAVLARTIIELSVSLIYILRNDQEQESWARYSAGYLNEEGARIRNLEKVAANLSGAEAESLVKEVSDRKSALANIRAALESALAGVGAPGIGSVRGWPDVFERFKALGVGIDYRTFYATLSSDVHGDAGALVSYFTVAGTGNEEKVQLLESAFARSQGLSLWAAIRYYLYALASYAKRFGLEDASEKIAAGQAIIGARQRDFLDGLDRAGNV